MVNDLDFQSLIAAQVLPLQRADNSFIIRQTTLSAQATSGATGVSLASLAGFGIGSAISFADTLGEERLYVSDGWGGANPVSLDFTGRGYSSLQHTHLSGATVYTNLFDFTPWAIADMLMSGDPVVFVRVTQTPYRQIAMPKATAGTYTARLEYHRVLNAPGEESGQRINANAWAEKQERLARSDVALINTALLSNQELIGEHTPALATQMAPLNSNGDKTVVRWGPPTVVLDNTYLFATLDAVYVAKFQPV